MERSRRTGSKPITNKERRQQWENLDGLNVPEGVAPKALQHLMKIIREPKGEYGPDHQKALVEAHNFIRYGMGLKREDQAGLIVSVTKDIVGRDNLTEEADKAYHHVRHEVLPQILGVTFFVKSGKELGYALEEGQSIPRSAIIGPDADQRQFPTLTSVAPAVASQVIKRFNEYGLTQYNVDTWDDEASNNVPVESLTEEERHNRTYIALGNKKKADHYLETGLVETARMMSSFYKTSARKFEDIDSIVEHLDKHDQDSQINKVKIKTEADSVRVWPINELRIGHQDGKEGIKLVKQTVEMISELPVEKRPHVITVTNLVQSDFEHSQSQKRQALGIKEMSEQYSAANRVLDLLKTLGIPIVVSLGQDDHRIAKDSALNYVNEMNTTVSQGGKEDFIPYYNVNKLMQDKQHQVHKRFHLENIIPLQYRMGRLLRDKDTVRTDTGGDLHYSEYFALYDNIEHGSELHEGLGIDPDVIVPLGAFDKDGVCFVDDFNLLAETEGANRDIAYRHVTEFTAESLKQTHLRGLLRLMGSYAASHGTDDMADIVMTGQQQEQYSIANKAFSLPGLWDTGKSLNRRQYFAAAPGDASRRANLMRGIPGIPTMNMVEMTDDDRIIQTFISKEFMDKADSLPRTAIFEFCDTQIGSISARPDIQIMYLSYMLETAKEMPITINVAGDMVHGFIYPTFAEESQSVGLIGLKSQKIMMKKILERVFDTSDPIIAGLLENVVDCVVQPGNHDKIMRPRFPNNLDDNMDYLENAFKRILDKDGEPSRVRSEAVFEQDGTPVGTWMARTHLGAYSILTAHYHMEKKGMGGGGGFPVADAYRRVQGFGERAPDILMGAHWHNPQTAMFGNVLSVIGGPMAGQTEFEDFRGMKATPFGTIVKIGGGEPVAVESLSKETLRRGGSSETKLRNGRVVTGAKYGQFTSEKLAERGLVDDEGFDFKKHGIFMHPDFPKSALQQAIRKDVEDASHLMDHRGETQNPYHRGEENLQTRRAREIAQRIAEAQGLAN